MKRKTSEQTFKTRVNKKQLTELMNDDENVKV